MAEKKKQAENIMIQPENWQLRNLWKDFDDLREARVKNFNSI